MKAVVMAGGEGSRLRPITANRPKPLAPVGNRPIMEHIVGLLKKNGITEVVCTLHYLADEISSYFDDGMDFGIPMQYSIEDTPLGTAGSVKKAEAFLKDDTFCIISGDALTDVDLTKAVAYHKEKGAIATLILCRVPNPLEFGVVITDEEGRVVRFLEKPSWSEVFSDTVNTGMYILEPEVFDLMREGKAYDWSQDIFPELMRQEKPVFGYIMDEYWSDIGTLPQYREAQEHLLSGRMALEPAGESISPGIWVGANTVIENGATIIPPTCIGRNCKIKSGARVGPYTVIGDNALVESGANIERSVVWDSAYLGANVGVYSAIIGSRVTVKMDTVIREDAVIGDRCLIDVGCTIRPRIKLWPDKVVERGSTVTMSLVWGNKWRGSLFRELGVAGLSNIEITPDFATRLGSAFGSIFPPGSKVVTGRDSSRSSRMIKRAVMAALLSVGCEVIDLRSASLPVLRHFVRSSGTMGAIYVRKLPGNRRVTLIEFLDSQGMYLSRAQERKIESAFFREDFNRIDPDDLGQIDFASRAVEEYQSDFLRLLQPSSQGRRLKLVCDYGYSAIGPIFPAMLAQYNVESINSHSYNDARAAPRNEDDVARHLGTLKQIVASLDYDMGVLFLNEGERLILVDNLGRIIEGTTLLGALCRLIAETQQSPTIVMSVTASSKLEQYLVERGVNVVRSKADTRSLIATSQSLPATFAGDDRGGFIFPEFHAGFDAMFSLVSLVQMLQKTNLTLREVVDALPEIHLGYEVVRCPWEHKGTVMRKLAEQSDLSNESDLIDGIRIPEGNGWALVIADAVEPIFHIHTEADSRDACDDLARRYAQTLVDLQSSSN